MNTIKIERKLDIPFRGGRDYIYASDTLKNILSTIAREYPSAEISDIDFATHSLATSQLILNLSEKSETDLSKAHAIFCCKLSGKDVFGILSESGEKITKRIPYVEDDIMNLAELDKEKKEVSIARQTGYDVIDVFTCLNKFLLSNIFRDISGHWLSVRTKLSKTLSNEYDVAAVKFERIFGNKYTLSKLYYNDEVVGTLNFSIR